MPFNRDELEAFSTHALHDLAIRNAVQHLDLKFLWRLLETIPAAEAAAGHENEAEIDVLKFSELVNDAFHAGDTDVGEALRPLYIEYLASKG
jgi:hypothetical protein